MLFFRSMSEVLERVVQLGLINDDQPSLVIVTKKQKNFSKAMDYSKKGHHPGRR